MISVVIPLWNEANSLVMLHQELRALAESQENTWEWIFVDDGSTDESWRQIEKLAAADSRIRGIRLRRNFGKADALQAGFKAARGGLVVTLDADLQDDPRDIPQLIAHLGNELDVVSGWKRQRLDPISRRMASRVFNALVNFFTGVRLHDHNCGLKCYRAEVVKELTIYGELHRFLPVLAAARGFRVGELPVHHRRRPHGRSKYGWRRIPRGLLDLMTVVFLTGFSRRPQHLLGGIGGGILLVSGFFTAILTIQWCASRVLIGATPVHLHERALFYYSLAGLLLGAQLLSLGLLAELFAWVHHRQRPSYSVARMIPDELASKESE